MAQDNFLGIFLYAMLAWTSLADCVDEPGWSTTYQSKTYNCTVYATKHDSATDSPATKCQWPLLANLPTGDKE